MKMQVNMNNIDFQKLFQPIVRREPTPQEKDELSKIYYYIIVNSCLKKVHWKE